MLIPYKIPHNIARHQVELASVSRDLIPDADMQKQQQPDPRASHERLHNIIH